ncbi:hypothetical protein TNCV_2327351 [Trichonephila clavipes]|nr:hypothetical protein TNCV_2327351 [Trichonephila clavipes]
MKPVSDIVNRSKAKSCSSCGGIHIGTIAAIGTSPNSGIKEDDEVKEAIQDFLENQSRSFYSEGPTVEKMGYALHRP